MAYLSSEIFELQLSEQFRIMKDGLTNAKGSELSQPLEIFGYTPERVDEGLNLVLTARDLHSTQQKEYGEQYSATETRDKLKEDADKRTNATWKIAKIAVKDNALRTVLGLHQNRRQSLNGWMTQNDQFYRNMSQEILDYLSNYGYTAQKIDEERGMVEEVIEADKVQRDESGEAQAATIKRDEAVDALHDWMKDFYKVAKVAFEDQPHLLEKLGIIHRR